MVAWRRCRVARGDGDAKYAKQGRPDLKGLQLQPPAYVPTRWRMADRAINSSMLANGRSHAVFGFHPMTSANGTSNLRRSRSKKVIMCCGFASACIDFPDVVLAMREAEP